LGPKTLSGFAARAAGSVMLERVLGVDFDPIMFSLCS
jgi:hypothetical protein